MSRIMSIPSLTSHHNIERREFLRPEIERHAISLVHRWRIDRFYNVQGSDLFEQGRLIGTLVFLNLTLIECICR